MVDVRISRHLFALLAPYLAFGCGDELPLRATLVQPVLGDPCQYAECGEHGQCRIAGDGGPVCDCEVGYGGVGCEGCEPGFHRDALQRCAPDKSCAEQDKNPCGDAGSCSDEAGVISCHCDPGYEGPRCTLCKSGFARDNSGDCLELVLSQAPGTLVTDGSLCAAESCNGNGLCDDSSGLVVCTCNEGYGGMRCANCEAGYRRDETDSCVPKDRCSAYSCGGHGICDDASGKVTCRCDAGYGLPFCAGCAAGYHADQAEGCARDSQCLQTTCGGHGTCTKNGATLTCTCASGYQGERCDSCATGYHRDGGYACVVNEVCTATKCGGHGVCSDTTGVAVCSCELGSAAATCNECASGFHKGPNNACVVDAACKADSCPARATCTNPGGEIVCTCMTGYTGVECDSCAAPYVRNASNDRCELLACASNPITSSGEVNFENVANFPAFENNCVSGLDVSTPQLGFESGAGSGEVWACSANSLYAAPSNHIFLEATSDRPARIVFKGPVSEFVFDYGARSALSLEIVADGQPLRSLDAARRASGSISMMFATPITVLAFKSKTPNTNQIALDNLKYTPPVCR